MRDKTAGVWSRFAVEDGLPDAHIECLYQDRHDRIWLGTSDRGVACFDHKTVATFTHQDGLSGNRVHGIVEDAAGRIWLGTNRGLTWYDDEGFHPLASSLSHSFLGGGCADAEGGVWFGLEQHPHAPPRLAHWDGQQFRLISLTDRAPIHGESIHALAIDTQGIIWCGGRSLYSYDRTSDISHRHEGGPNAEVTSLLPRSDGTLWLVTRVGVFVFDGQDFRLLEPSRQHPFLAIVEDPRSETIYLTSSEGILACCDGERMDFAYRGDLSFSPGLCVDHLGRLWVGTHDRGLYCYNSQRLQVFGPDQGLPATRLTCIAQRDTGPLWTSTQGDLVRFPQQSSAETIAVPECEKIAALCLDRDARVWFGGTGTGLYRYDYDGRRLELMHQPEHSAMGISAIAIDEYDRVWFAYQRGAGLGYVEDGQVHWFELATPTQIDVLAWSRQGHLWLGSNPADEKHGLYRFDGTTCTKVDAGPTCLIFALCEGADGRLWIGTNQGLWCLNEERIQHFTRSDGLPCDTITSIIQARDGRLWMGTEGHGLCGYDYQVFQKVEVPELSLCNTVHDLVEGRDGALYLATKGDLVRYAPQRIPPQVAIVTLEADASYETVIDQTIHLSEMADSVRIRFEGTSPLDSPSHLIYRYRLDGLESEWRQTAETQVEYPPLQPGAYAFCLQAVDRDLTYSEQVRVQFEITADARMDVLQRWFIGQSPVIRQVEADFLKAAETDLTVLLLGATGTGKSLAAQAIHELSVRREAPFVAVNCGLLGRELINNELFGHEKGAFTGADNRYLGKFEQANQGTLFLDEIGDLTLDVQANLLEVLQEQQIYRVGGNQVIPVDVRIIAATHENLEQAVARGTFRADLFYRLEGLPIRIPNLKERPEDIPLLAEYFATRFASQLKQPVAPIRPAALEALQAYDWPGNVRQLEHAVERAVLAARGGPLEPDHFSQSMASPYQREGAIVPLEDHLRQYLTRVLDHTNGVIYGQRGAARLLGVHPNTLRSRLRKLGIPFRKKERKDGP